MAKVVTELKPKEVLTQNMSRPELMRWVRQMRSYFTASGFDREPKNVQVCYLEERMDTASQQLLRKLCNDEPEKYGMEMLYSLIKEKVVRTASLQQRRVSEMITLKQRAGELYSTTLVRFDETEKDVDINNYTVAELRAHLRVCLLYTSPSPRD